MKVAVASVCPVALAVTVIVVVPGVVGTPEITPVVGFRVRPSGRVDVLNVTPETAVVKIV